MSYQRNIVSFLGPPELDQLIYYLRNATSNQISQDVYHGDLSRGIIARSMSHDLLGWIYNLDPIYKARLCTSAKVFYLKNK